MKRNLSEINIFSERLKKRCFIMGYKTEKMFFEAFSKVHDDISSYTVHSWWSYVSLPDIKNTKRICDFLECDIDYLYGRINESTHDYAFINSITGLTESAIKCLHNSNDISIGQLFKTKYKPLSAAVNHLLTTEHGLTLLQYIFDYITSDSMSLSYQGKAISEDIKISNPHTDNSYYLSPNEYDSLLLAQIQKELILLKNSEKKFLDS